MAGFSRTIVIMGFPSVGKSSMTIQYVEGHFAETYDPTIENTFATKVKLKGQEFHVKMVDTAGQDEHAIFPQQYSMYVSAYCLVYSITSRKSFKVVKVIYDKLIDLVGQNANITLVGNKNDLEADREVSKAEGQNLAQEMGATFVELSAKKHNQVEALFNAILVSTTDPAEKSKCIMS